MKEKIYTTKKNGMAVLIGTILLLIAGLALMIIGPAFTGTEDGPGWMFGVGVLILCFGWIPFLGLRVLKPQEALVLTLFGKYAGTIKGDGFYFVNPFCTSVNPAAKTRLGQSGDVENESHSRKIMISSTAEKQKEEANKKISLKAMTLSNAKQKVNDVSRREGRLFFRAPGTRS